MKNSITISMLAALLLSGNISIAEAQNQMTTAQIEHELAITAYNYAVGCAERQKYEEALEGLTHIPANQLNAQQQGWADSLRMKCEAMVNHPMAEHEVPMKQSEMMQLDDQSNEFIRGIRYYQSGDYAKAIEIFNDVYDMGIGPHEQCSIESLFWRGQCNYQLKNWEQCCNDLILFNDTKNANTDLNCDAYAYYTMGYARLQMQKWHQARLNFERYLDRKGAKAQATYADGQKRYQESKQLEATNGKSAMQLPLEMAKVDPVSGETVSILNSLKSMNNQIVVEKQENDNAVSQWRDWYPPYIPE